jgi:hypothetical protein
MVGLFLVLGIVQKSSAKPLTEEEINQLIEKAVYTNLLQVEKHTGYSENSRIAADAQETLLQSEHTARRAVPRLTEIAKHGSVPGAKEGAIHTLILLAGPYDYIDNILIEIALHNPHPMALRYVLDKEKTRDEIISKTPNLLSDLLKDKNELRQLYGLNILDSLLKQSGFILAHQKSLNPLAPLLIEKIKYSKNLSIRLLAAICLEAIDKKLFLNLEKDSPDLWKELMNLALNSVIYEISKGLIIVKPAECIGVR